MLNEITDVKVYLSVLGLLEDGINLLSFEPVKKSIQNLIGKHFPDCDVFVSIENAEATHIHFLDRDGNFVCAENESLWARVILAIETVLNDLRHNSVYPYLN